MIQHGGNIWLHENKVLDFSASLSPLGMPPEVMKAAMGGVEASVHYPDPDCAQLREAISETVGVEKAFIVCGNGAAELLDRLALALGRCKVLTLAPTFGEYERSFRSVGARIRYYYLKEERDFLIAEGFLRYLRPDLDLVILCNPNNPTGKTIPIGLLEQLIALCKERGIRLLLDESFLDLTDDEKRWDAAALLKTCPNLLLLRSLTKSYCMPGLRLGYLLCSDSALLDRMKQLGQPWSVSVPAQFAGVAALRSCPNWPQEGRRLIRPQRERMLERLREMGVQVWPSEVNFLLFRVPGRKDLCERLLERGILIRSCESFRGLGADYYRIAVRTEEENTVLLREMKELLAGRE